MGEVLGGRYELVDVLGSGGVGTVWRVWDRRESAYRAAKVLRQSDGDSLLRFVRETSRHVAHPHVVAPYGWAGEDDRVLFSMPLVRGGSLATLLGDHGPLPTGWAVELTRQALLALDEVHRLGLVHRDVKPANLLLEATGTGPPHLMLSDFGAAAQLGAPRLTRTDLVVGTPGYLAPEQLAGADPAPTQDLYAVGVVLAQLVTGDAPPASGEVPEVPATHPVASLVASLTDPDPQRRPPTARRALALLDDVPGVHDLTVDSDSDDPVEVFDHVPPLPPGWTADGPATGGPATGGPPPARPAAVPASDAPTRLVPREPVDGRPARSTRWWRAVPALAWVLLVVGVVLLVAALVVG